MAIRGGDEISVVHVDDEPDVGSLVAAFLERYDGRLSVATATGAGAALDRLTADVDCIVSDYEMPGTDGIEFLEDRAGFYVEDDGLGISGHERSRIFQSGYSTSADGTGFGLSIVHVIVAAHDWEITVTTEPAAVPDSRSPASRLSSNAVRTLVDRRRGGGLVSRFASQWIASTTGNVGEATGIERPLLVESSSTDFRLSIGIQCCSVV